MGLFQNGTIEIGAMGVLMRSERKDVIEFAGETYDIK